MESISQTAPILPGRPVLQQFWADLTFLHWRVDASVVAPLLPPGIVPDIFDGSSWVGLIPFRMIGSAFFGGPAVPYFGTFTEVNVRLYGVDEFGRRGVVFASLEASRLAAVVAARAVFGLPYFWASADFGSEGTEYRYASKRIGGGGPTTRIVSRVSGVPVVDDPLADFLTARWRLFVGRGGKTAVQANRHGAWPLLTAELIELDDALLAAAGLPGIADRAPDSVLFSPGVLTQFSGAQPITAPERGRFGLPGATARPGNIVGDTGLEPMTSSV
ncbi:YqjF family protein [Glaciihabitans sp. INWT7]|uniref:YqjF family protein n=1 Tax=Glaciihabitans sp. INWT7 TaxID=2596912 RepID=UPI00351C17BE